MTTRFLCVAFLLFANFTFEFWLRVCLQQKSSGETCDRNLFALQVDFNKFLSPEDVLDCSEGEMVDKVLVQSPVFDYVPPKLVTLYITNM